jgi:hypothetical protein
MKTTEEKINSDVKKALQTSFSNFEGDFGDAFDKNILKSLRKPLWRRPHLVWSLMGIVTCLTLGIFLVLHVVQGNKNVVKANSTFSDLEKNKGVHVAVAGEKKSTGSKPESTASSRRFQSKIETQSRSSETITVNMKPMGGVQHKTSINKVAVQNKSLPAKESPIATDMLDHKNLLANLDTVTSFGNVHNAKHQSSGNSDSMVTTHELTIIENRNVTSLGGLKMPLIEVNHKEAKVSPIASINRHKFIFSFTPTKVYYGLYLKPGVNTRIQDVSITKSLLSVGMKVSTGIEIEGTQLLLNYSHLDNKIAYGIATEKFVTQEIRPGEYLVKRLGDNKELQIPRNWFGIGIKRQLTLKYLHRNSLFATIGGDFLRAFQPANTNQIQANFMVGKRFSLSSGAVGTLGPYFEYGITKQAFLNGQLQVKQYQYGISLGLKLN